MNPAPKFWNGRRVLVTGHTGFKGARLWQLLPALGAEFDQAIAWTIDWDWRRHAGAPADGLCAEQIERYLAEAG